MKKVILSSICMRHGKQCHTFNISMSVFLITDSHLIQCYIVLCLLIVSFHFVKLLTSYSYLNQFHKICNLFEANYLILCIVVYQAIDINCNTQYVDSVAFSSSDIVLFCTYELQLVFVNLA